MQGSSEGASIIRLHGGLACKIKRPEKRRGDLEGDIDGKIDCTREGAGLR